MLGEDLITTAAFNPDGSRLAVGDVPGRVTLWDGTARTRLGVLDGTTSDPTTEATGAVTALAFHALAFGSDGSLHAPGTHVPVQRYDLNPLRLITEVCERAGSGLSESVRKT
ncbi:hypothetical protein [Streptomyces sviceus]|uniref:hypothetical protein n=1 Tax=Streptomyces sviceus TaxID=285530 RepID=UPI00368FE5CD